MNLDKIFWSKVNKNGPIQTHVPNLGMCWEWAGPTDGKYGILSIKRKLYRVHRFSALLHGIINTLENPSLCVCHKCDNKICVNPKHLWIGTVYENNKDRDNKKRSRGQPKGEGNIKAKLVTSQVLEIRRLYKTGEYTLKQLAEMYKISQQHTNNIILKVRWKHI